MGIVRYKIESYLRKNREIRTLNATSTGPKQQANSKEQPVDGWPQCSCNEPSTWESTSSDVCCCHDTRRPAVEVDAPTGCIKSRMEGKRLREEHSDINPRMFPHLPVFLANMTAHDHATGIKNMPFDITAYV